MYSRNDGTAEIIEDSIWKEKELDLYKNKKVITYKYQETFFCKI
jgi:hypothetical protein